jgi:putative phosphonate transport system ATP-binding protein
VVMQRGRVVEAGLTDQVLDDPQHSYTQLLVSSVLQP